MITDAQLTFSDAQAVTTTAASANQIDLTTARSLSRTGAQGLRIVVLVTTAFAGGTSIAVTVRQSAAANMSSPDIIATGPTVALANLTAGSKVLDIPFPDPDPVAAKQYLDLNYTVVGTMTAGALSAFIVMDDGGGQYTLGTTGL
jgi:hypothetical protein